MVEKTLCKADPKKLETAEDMIIMGYLIMANLSNKSYLTFQQAIEPLIQGKLIKLIGKH